MGAIRHPLACRVRGRRTLTVRGSASTAGAKSFIRDDCCAASYGAEGFVCPECEGRQLRSTVVGARRTAEELGRAFPGVPVRTSGSGWTRR